jgi:hypothetical protein
MLENPNAIANIVSGADLTCFDQRWVLGAQVGKDESSNFALSFNGLAVRTPDNRFVVPQLSDDGAVKLIDVTCLTIAADPYVFRIPVSVDDVEPGHLLVRSDSPFSLLFVEKNLGGSRIQGIDPRSDEAVEILVPDKSLAVPTMLVRVVSLFDRLDGITEEDDDDATGAGSLSRLLPFLLAGGGGLGTVGGNSPALLALALSLSKSSKFDARLAVLLMASGNQTNSLVQAMLFAALSGRHGIFGTKPRKRDPESSREASEATPTGGPEPKPGGRAASKPPADSRLPEK